MVKCTKRIKRLTAFLLTEPQILGVGCLCDQPTNQQTDMSHTGARMYLKIRRLKSVALLGLQISDKRSGITYSITTKERTGCAIEKNDVTA